jgi:hypothetical protein
MSQCVSTAHVSKPARLAAVNEGWEASSWLVASDLTHLAFWFDLI